MSGREINSSPKAPAFSDYIMILGAVTIWGGSFASTKYALAELTPTMVMALRMLFAVPALASGCLADRSLRLPNRREFLTLLLLGFQGIFFHQAIQAWGMQTAGAGNASWMMVASPALVALLGWIFLREKITLAGAAGIVISAAGVLLVLALGTVKETAEAASFGTAGDWVILFSVLNWAVFLILSRYLLRDGICPSFAIFWEVFFSTIFALILTLTAGSDWSAVSRLSAGTWGSLFFLGAFSSGLAYLLWYRGLSVLPVAKLIVFQFLQPVAGMVISYLLIGERYTLWLALGAVMIITGICLVNKKQPAA